MCYVFFLFFYFFFTLLGFNLVVRQLRYANIAICSFVNAYIIYSYVIICGWLARWCARISLLYIAMERSNEFSLFRGGAYRYAVTHKHKTHTQHTFTRTDTDDMFGMYRTFAAPNTMDVMVFMMFMVSQNVCLRTQGDLWMKLSIFGYCSCCPYGYEHHWLLIADNHASDKQSQMELSYSCRVTSTHRICNCFDVE